MSIFNYIYPCWFRKNFIIYLDCMKTLLITGVDTEVGKTILTTSLVAYCQKYLSSLSLGLMKLMQTGLGDDELYHQLFQNVDIVTPISFKTPVAPPIAATIEGQDINLGLVWQELNRLQSQHDFIFVEALGGLGTPVTAELTVADIASSWRLPTVLVVPVKLGAIGQTVANVALARYSKVNLKGIIFNCIDPTNQENSANLTPKDLIQSLTNVPVLGTIPYLINPTNLDSLAESTSNLDLEQLIFGYKWNYLV